MVVVLDLLVQSTIVKVYMYAPARGRFSQSPDFKCRMVALCECRFSVRDDAGEGELSVYPGSK